MSEKLPPKHIAIIMDGNGRWAKSKHLPRSSGHQRGVQSVRKIVKHCAKIGVNTLTLFAFSSENMKRSDEEVSILFKLFLAVLKSETKKLKDNNIEMAYLTLHVGPGTFKPIRIEDFSKHEMEAEIFRITPKNWNLITESKKKGQPILAVGTTSTRALEAQAFKKPIRKTRSGSTNCFIIPGWHFKNVDHLLTNFHLPKSTLYLLVSAFCGKTLAKKAYNEAISRKYRFFSYGDAMFLPRLYPAT